MTCEAVRRRMEAVVAYNAVLLVVFVFFVYIRENCVFVIARTLWDPVIMDMPSRRRVQALPRPQH